MHETLEHDVAAHYGRTGLLDAILTGLEEAGADPDHPTPEDLAPVDEFHTAGRVTTLKALEMAPIEAGMHVLDAGCGIGGTARVLAAQRGCRVVGIDLTPEYIDVAKALTERMRLSESCRFQVGSVVDMPFADASFDAAVSFHVAMNVEDRGGFYGGLARVLKPGAPLCIFDVMNGPAPGMSYPVPWAETAATSFLRSPEQTCELLREAGFEITARESVRDFAIDFFRNITDQAADSDGPPPLGLHLLAGANSAEKFTNYIKSLEAHQIDPVIVVANRR